MSALPKKFTDSNKPQLFDGVADETLQKILAFSIAQDHEAHTLLVQQGDTPQGIYLILDGNMKTLRLSENGDEATIRMLEVGDTCMEAVLFMGGPSPISVQTLSKCKVLLIPERVVKAHIMSDPRFAMNIIRIVTRHYKNAMHQIDAMTIKSPIQRVGYYFLTKHLEAGHDSLDFKLPFKKQTIANYLGMTPETFSRTLKQMKDMGIEVEDDVIRMKDAFSLCHFCDSDTASLCDKHGHDACAQCPMH
jgi:CRP-like cAMP-binding protein